MKKNFSNLLKNLLTTSSVIALTVDPANTAIAGSVSRISQNNLSSVGVSADWNPNGFNSGDFLIYGGNHTIQAVDLGNFSINVIDTAANPIVGSLIVGDKGSGVLTIGAISSTAGGGSVPIEFSSNQDITLATIAGGGGIAPNDYSKFGSLDFNGNILARFIINNTTPVSLSTNFLSTGGNSGEIIVNDNVIVTFNGTFSSVFDTSVAMITLNPGAKATFNNNVNLIDGIGLGADSIAQFAAGVEINGVDIFATSAFHTGKIILESGDTVNSKIGFNRALASVEIGDGEVTFNGSNLTTDALSFTGVNSSLRFNDVGQGNITVTSGGLSTANNLKGKIKLNNNLILYSTIGRREALFEKLSFEGDYFLRNFDNQFYVTSITSSNNGQGTLVMRSNADKVFDSDMGSESNKLSTIIASVGETGFSVPPARATKAIIKNGRKVYANNFKLYDFFEANYLPLDSSTLIIEDDTFIDAPVTTTNLEPFSGSYGVNFSEVEVKENSTILQDIGQSTEKISSIKLSGSSNDTVNLSGDLYGNNITLSQPNIVLGDDLVFNGTVTSTSTTFSLGTRTLTFDSAGESQLLESPTVNFTVNDKTHGHFIVRGGLVNMETIAPRTLYLNLTDQAVILPPAGPVGQSYTVFGIVENDGQITVVNDAKVLFNIIAQNPFVTWSYTNGIATRKRLTQDQVNNIINDIVTSNGGSSEDLANALNLANEGNQSDAASLFQDLTVVILGPGAVQALQTLQTVIVEAAEQISEIVDQAINNISNRLRSLGIYAFSLAQSDGSSGIAAGDGEYKNGVWIDSFLSSVRQKSNKNSPGFKSSSYGGMIGADTMIEDGRTLGISIGYTVNKVKHKDSNEGDKSHVTTYTASIYGMQEINDKWFTQGVALFSRNRIRNDELRGIIQPRVAHSDFATNAYAVELMVGYNKQISNNILFTPMVGVDYTYLEASKYKETGTTNQNLLISKNSDHKLNAILGGSLSFDNKISYYRITPEVHTYVTYDLLNRSPKISAELSGLVNPLVLRTVEQGRVFYNVGANISTAYRSMDFSVSYDLFLGKKYRGLQGSIKARINF